MLSLKVENRVVFLRLDSKHSLLSVSAETPTVLFFKHFIYRTMKPESKRAEDS